VRKAARDLILAREDALKKLTEGDAFLKHELEKAKKSADRVRAIGYVGAAPGAGSSQIGSNSTASSPGSPKSATPVTGTPGGLRMGGGNQTAVPNNVLIDRQAYELLKQNDRPVNHIPVEQSRP